MDSILRASASTASRVIGRPWRLPMARMPRRIAGLLVRIHNPILGKQPAPVASNQRGVVATDRTDERGFGAVTLERGVVGGDFGGVAIDAHDRHAKDVANVAVRG